MIEELLMNVVNAMSGSLDEEQLDKLQNILYINFHNIKVVEEKNELQATGTDGDTMKMRLFVASKKVSGRQDNTLAQYIREITNCRNALRKNIEDITTMDLRWYFGMLRERNKISMVTLQGRMRYLNSFWTFLQKENLVKDNPVARIESLRIESTIKKSVLGAGAGSTSDGLCSSTGQSTYRVFICHRCASIGVMQPKCGRYRFI